MLVSQVGGDSALIAWARCGDVEGHRDAARRDHLPASLRPQKPKTLQDSPSHRILRHMYRVLNIDKNKN